MTDIRLANSDDISSLYKLYNLIGVKDEGYFERCLNEHAMGNRDIYIAMVDRENVGFCILNWKPRYAVYQRMNIPEIQDLNIIPHARRQGHAKALILHCENQAKRKGCDTIGVSVGLNADYGPAQRLYFDLGYAPDGNGATYDREPVAPTRQYHVDDDLCLMLVKGL